MKLTVMPYRIDPRDLESLRSVVETFNNAQSEFALELVSRAPGGHTGEAIDWAAFRRAMEGSARQDYLMAVTSVPLVDNWYSHTADRLTLMTTYGWREYYVLPGVNCYLLAELVVAIYYMAIDINEEKSEWHEESIGCIHDLCGHKPDMLWKMRVGYLCPAHRALFLAHGGSENKLRAFDALLDEVRRMALGRAPTEVQLPRDDGTRRTRGFTMADIKEHPVIVAAAIFAAGAGIAWAVAMSVVADPLRDQLSRTAQPVNADVAPAHSKVVESGIERVRGRQDPGIAGGHQ